MGTKVYVDGGLSLVITSLCPQDETLSPPDINQAGIQLPVAVGFFLLSNETSDATVCQEVSSPMTWPILDIMLSLSLHTPKKGLSCFSRLDNYFPLIPPCQGQS